MRDSPAEIEKAYDAETRELIRRRATVAGYLALVGTRYRLGHLWHVRRQGRG